MITLLSLRHLATMLTKSLNQFPWLFVLETYLFGDMISVTTFSHRDLELKGPCCRMQII